MTLTWATAALTDCPGWHATPCTKPASMTAGRPVRAMALTAAIAIVAALLYLGAQPMAAHLLASPWDKLAHFLCFGAVAALLCIWSNGKRPALTIGATVAIGMIDEWRQAGLPGRSADFGDLLVDAAAAICAVLLYRYVAGRRSRRQLH